MPYLTRPLSMVTVLFLAMCCYFAAVSAKPVREKSLDIAGVYLSSRNGSDPVYRVTVTLVKGVWCSSWVVIAHEDGKPSYMGRIDLQPDGSYRETYRSDVEALQRCGPWTWRVFRDRPLSFEDSEGPRGWDLVTEPPDF